jgi:hypothetical protein
MSIPAESGSAASSTLLAEEEPDIVGMDTFGDKLDSHDDIVRGFRQSIRYKTGIVAFA